jgi:hypothetical protein
MTGACGGGDVAEHGKQRKPPEGRPEVAEMLKQIQKAEAGDDKALAFVRQAFDQAPGAWESYGNLALRAEGSMIRVAAGDNPLMKEALTRQLEKKREELAGPNPTPLERLLAERVALCWLHATHADAVYPQALGQRRSLELGDSLQRRQDRTHRRLLASIRTLALVRRLAVPPLRPPVVNEQATRGEFLEIGDAPQARTVAGSDG